MKTAMDVFAAGVESEKHITIAFQIEDEDGDIGLAAQAIPITNPSVRGLALSEDWRDRAKISLLAIDFAHKQLEQDYDGLTPVVQ